MTAAFFITTMFLDTQMHETCEDATKLNTDRTGLTDPIHLEHTDYGPSERSHALLVQLPSCIASLSEDLYSTMMCELYRETDDIILKYGRYLHNGYGRHNSDAVPSVSNHATAHEMQLYTMVRKKTGPCSSHSNFQQQPVWFIAYGDWERAFFWARYRITLHNVRILVRERHQALLADTWSLCPRLHVFIVSL